MKIIDELKDLATAEADAMRRRKDDALKVYRDVLWRSNKPQKGDAVALKAAIETMGLTAEDLEYDARNVADYLTADARIVAPEVQHALAVKHEAAVNARIKESQEWEDRKHQLDTAEYDARNERDAADAINRKAAETRARVMNACPRLFGHHKESVTVRKDPWAVSWGLINSDAMPKA